MTAPTFPDVPLDLVAELYVNNGWTDITSDVQVADGNVIKIGRGRPNEKSDPQPSSCTLRLKNLTGTYSPRNPVGPYYGSLNRNTPIRVARRVAKDTFTRTVSGGWSSADVGGLWSTAGVGGTVQSSDWNVNGSAGTMLVPVSDGFRFSYLAGQLHRDVDIAGTVSVGFSNVTGGNVILGALLVAGLSTVDYFKVVLKVTTAEALLMSITHPDGTVVVADTAVGFTFTGQAIRLRAQVDGQTIRGKAWAAAGVEPYAWIVEGRTDRLFGRASGWVGVRSDADTSNTNVPFTVSWDNVDVRSNRFHGEISKFGPKWDTSGRNIWTMIEAAGPRRRLGQGQTPLKSTYRRGHLAISPAHLAYWPCEDGQGATSIASGLPGGTPMVVNGSPQFASNTDFPGSAPIPKVNGSGWYADIAGAAATGQIQATFLLSIPAAGESADDAVFRINTSGTAAFWDLAYSAGGALYLRAFDQARQIIYTSSSIAFGIDGLPVQVSIELTQNGSNVDWTVATLVPGQFGGASGSATVTGVTIGAITGVFASQYRQLGANTAIGHIAARNNIISIFTLTQQLAAYAGETVGSRIGRLATENNLAASYLWNGQIGSQPMGIQGRKNLTDLLDECAHADMASLYESRSILGFVFRMRSSLYNQPTALALDYSVAGHVAPPLLPVEDDQTLINDMTASRTSGSSYEAIQSTGRLAVTAPTAGSGAGRYDDATELNLAADTQVPDAASWLLHMGTVDEQRYPSVKVMLAKLTKANPQLALDALSVNLDDKVAIANLPTHVSYDPLALLARGYTEELSLFRHDIVFNCAPASPYEVLQLDTAGKAKLDSSDSVLAAAATSGATSLYVASPTNQAWTADPAQMPIPIRVAGETMSITAVANEMLSNPDFESGLSPWTSTGTSSFTQSGTQKHGGSFAARLVPTGAAARTFTSSELIPVTPGQLVTVSGWMWTTNAVTNNASVGISWYDASQVNNGESHNFVSVSATTWTPFANIFTVPANAAYAQVVAVIGGTPVVGQIFYVDDCSLQGTQKFTVTRSTNGVVKAQAVGAQVKLARPATLAL